MENSEERKNPEANSGKKVLIVLSAIALLLMIGCFTKGTSRTQNVPWTQEQKDSIAATKEIDINKTDMDLLVANCQKAVIQNDSLKQVITELRVLAMKEQPTVASICDSIIQSNKNLRNTIEHQNKIIKNLKTGK